MPPIREVAATGPKLAGTHRVDVSRLLVLLAAMIAVSTFAGWVIDSPELESTGIALGPRMNPLTAVSLLSIGVAWILLNRFGQSSAARLVALLPLSIAGFRLIAYAIGYNSGFDFALFHDRILAQPHPNHIAPNSAITIAGLALSVILSGRNARWDAAASWVAILTGAMPFFAVLGFASRMSSLFGVKLHTPMALNSAATALLLVVAILASLKHTPPLRPFSSGGSGGILARRLFPVALGLPVLTGVLLNAAVEHAWMEKSTATTAFAIAVVVLIVIVLHRTASRLDEFDLLRTRQSETIRDQNLQLTGAVQELRTRSQELAEAHSSLKAVLDAATQTGIVGTDRLGTIRLFSRGAEALLGYGAAEVIGIKTLTFLCNPDAGGQPHGETAETTFESLIAPLQSSSFSERDIELIRNDGRRFTANLSLTAQLDPNQRAAGYVALIRDITELRRNEEALRAAKLEAESATRSKSAFLATMSHEIRTPMNGVIGMTGLLIDTDLSPEQMQYVATIRSSGEVLLAVINDILDFSKIEAGKIDLETTDFELYATIEECAEIVAVTAHRKGLELVLPARKGEPDLVRGDQGRLRQILLNLLSNAVKFTASGEVTIAADITPSGLSSIVRIEVKDTGIGIPDAVKPRLFEAFTQADSSTTRRFGGTGLGLAISQRLVHLMGGEIGFSSEEGHGSTFWFTVSVGRPQVQTARLRRVQGKTILIVDDNESNRRILQLQLQHNGYASRPARSAREALTILGENGPSAFDAVLSDLQMPDMDGLELVTAIRKIPHMARRPILLLTSHEDRERAKAVEVDQVLLKPVRESHLIRALERVFLKWEKVEAPAEQTLDEPSTSQQRVTCRVLVGEDNPVNQILIKLMLKKLGYEADIVANGLEVLRALQVAPYDVVLMDCQMPEMDGFEAAQAIRSGVASLAKIPIIAITANALSQDRERCVAAGMNDYLSKPIQAHELDRKLQAWVSQSRSERVATL